MDSVALRHDREVVSNNLTACRSGDRAACRNQMRSANDNFIKGYTYGLVSLKIFNQKWKQAVSDIIVGTMGTVMFSLDNLRMNLLHPGDLKRAGAREQYLGEQMNIFFKSYGDTLFLGIGLKKFNGDTRSEREIANEVIQHEIERMVKNYISWEVSNACNSSQACMIGTWYFVVNNPTLFTF
jgi:hypothetical protein